MATWISRRAPRRSINSARAKFRCWSPPTSPRAASIFPKSATSSISTCRIMPTTMSTASAAPAAPDAPAPRSRIVTPLDQKSLVAIEKLIGQTIPRVEGGIQTQPEDAPSSEQPAPAAKPQQRHSPWPRRPREGQREGHARAASRAANANPAAPVAAAIPARSRRPPVAAFTPPRHRRPRARLRSAAPRRRKPPRDPASEPADHSHLPAFLLRPVRARV